MSETTMNAVAQTEAPAEMSRLELIYNVAEQVNSTLELDVCLDRIIDGAYRIFRAEKLSLMLIDEATNETLAGEFANLPELIPDRENPEDDSRARPNPYHYYINMSNTLRRELRDDYGDTSWATRE